MEDKRLLDSWSLTTRDEEAFVREIDEMELHSNWISDVVSSELRLEPLEAPLFASQAAAQYGFDPAVRFISSDTASSCARMVPVFRVGGSECSFSDGVCVRHSKRVSSGPLQGVDAFAEDCKGLYAMFKASAEEIHRLARLEVQHPENCVILLCKKFGIPRKYGEAARVMAERFRSTGRPLSAHDVYLCLTAAVTEAKTSASMTTILNLQEQIAKVPFIDWSSYDVGGTVGWN